MRTYLIPVPHFNEIEKYNQKLLARHEKKASELHYKKQIPIRELFEEDRKALLCCRQNGSMSAGMNG